MCWRHVSCFHATDYYNRVNYFIFNVPFSGKKVLPKILKKKLWADPGRVKSRSSLRNVWKSFQPTLEPVDIPSGDPRLTPPRREGEFCPSPKPVSRPPRATNIAATTGLWLGSTNLNQRFCDTGFLLAPLQSKQNQTDPSEHSKSGFNSLGWWERNYNFYFFSITF